MAQTCKCTLLDKLTAEQFDTSYRTPKPVPKTAKVRARRTEAEQDDRDLLMFNAGRYSAGDRDQAATKAHKLFELIMSAN
jgi:hypothetical protein